MGHLTTTWLWNVGHLNFELRFLTWGGGFNHCKIKKVKCPGICREKGDVYTPSF